MQNWLGKFRDLSLPSREALLAASMVFLYLLTAPAAYWLGGMASLLAAAAAAAICLLASALALAMSTLLRQPALALYGLLLAIAMRTGIPLLFALIVRVHGTPLLESGFFYYLVVFYLIALAVETPLSLPCRRGLTTCAPISKNAV